MSRPKLSPLHSLGSIPFFSLAMVKASAKAKSKAKAGVIKNGNGKGKAKATLWRHSVGLWMITEMEMLRLARGSSHLS